MTSDVGPPTGSQFGQRCDGAGRGRSMLVFRSVVSVLVRFVVRMRRVLSAWTERFGDPHLPRTLSRRLRDAGFQIGRREVLVLLNSEYDPNSYSVANGEIMGDFAVARGGLTRDEADAWTQDLQWLGSRDATSSASTVTCSSPLASRADRPGSLASRGRARRRYHKAVQHVVGGQRQAVDQARTLGLAEAQGRRDPQLEAQPHHQPVHWSCPRTAPDRAGQRAECRAPASAKGPVSGLDKPLALGAWRPPQQGAHAARLLAPEGLGWSLLHEPELGGDHPHSGHGHRTDSPARSAAEYVAHTGANVPSLRSRCPAHLRFHPGIVPRPRAPPTRIQTSVASQFGAEPAVGDAKLERWFKTTS